ncbi:MAG: hypothetical protein NVS3B14_08880 [Ktedonobacteraceae bacterium]
MKALKQRQGLLRTFWSYVAPFRGRILLALSILIVDTLISLASPWLMKLIFDNVLLSQRLHSPWAWAIPQAIAQNRPWPCPCCYQGISQR